MSQQKEEEKEGRERRREREREGRERRERGVIKNVQNLSLMLQRSFKTLE